MSHLTYTSYEGYGERSKKEIWYSQAVRVGDRIECAGQGGWNRDTGEIHRETVAQIEQALENVEHNLRTAGAAGWGSVYSVRSYHLPLNDEAMATMNRLLKKYCPAHQPIWTVLGINRLGFDDMRVEIEVVAHVAEEERK
ncbi:l-psp endoribonuclease family protein [Phlyctema vagabunda]|uniref:L-psp endoribonuclease family protein n=1 Tax=Phlyctema vagabunda TaxID=108571 RepID=A0ABR4P803_9HELO